MVTNKKVQYTGCFRGGDGMINRKVVECVAAAEAAEFFALVFAAEMETLSVGSIEPLKQMLAGKGYSLINDSIQIVCRDCRPGYELEGMYLAQDDQEVAQIYFHVFVGVLDLLIFTMDSVVLAVDA